MKAYTFIGMMLFFCACNKHLKNITKEAPMIQNYPQYYYLEGKRATWLKRPVPLFYIHFNSPNDVYGYMGYYSFKGKTYVTAWKFKLYRNGKGYISDLMPQTGYDYDKTKRIYLENRNGTWFVTLPMAGETLPLSPLPSHYNNKERNYIYALATFYVLDFPYRSSNGGLLYESTYLQEPIFNLKFSDFQKKIDTMSFVELRGILHIKNKYLGD